MSKFFIELVEQLNTHSVIKFKNIFYPFLLILRRKQLSTNALMSASVYISIVINCYSSVFRAEIQLEGNPTIVLV